MKSATYVFACVLAGMAVSVQSSDVPVSAEVLKQPVFLICPHRTKFSAWSLYLEVDAKVPSKVLRLGLEELSGQNSKDSSYEAVLTAQSNAKVERKQVTALEAADFGKKEMRVEKDEALRVALSPASDGSYALFLSLRVGASDRFVIGGNNLKKNDVSLRFNAQSGTWSAQAAALTGAGGEKLVPANRVPMSGVLFPPSDTGIYTMLGVVNGSDVLTLMDRTVVPE